MKRISLVNDDLAHGFMAIDSFFDSFRPKFSYTLRGFDDDNYDLIPKPHYVETLITRKEEEIQALDRQKESEDRYYKQRRERLVEEKEKLLRLRDNKH
jgi:hypothetical protein